VPRPTVDVVVNINDPAQKYGKILRHSLVVLRDNDHAWRLIQRESSVVPKVVVVREEVSVKLTCFAVVELILAVSEVRVVGYR